MIILGVKSRMITVWSHLVFNIPRQYFQMRVAIQHSFESSKKEDSWFISENQMQTNGRASSQVYVSVVNREGKGLVTWSFTSHDWPEHSHPEIVMLDGFCDLVKPRNSKIQRKPENVILWRWDILQCSAFRIFLFGSHRQCLVGQLSRLQEQRCTIHIGICPFALSSTEEIRISQNKELPSFYWALRHRPEPWTQATYLHHSCLSAG